MRVWTEPEDSSCGKHLEISRKLYSTMYLTIVAHHERRSIMGVGTYLEALIIVLMCQSRVYALIRLHGAKPLLLGS